jgi:SNF2 family DNA or RNA helicase
MQKKLLSDLLPHQVIGTKWCLENEEGGCILSDEMGLGKTVEAISVMVSNLLRTLVIVPATLIDQWAQEIAKHSSGFQVYIHRGRNRDTSVWENYDIILSTYLIIANITNPIGTVDRVIIDEAHNLRNQSTKSFKRLRHVLECIPYRILMTGTPICNGYKDLISLFKMLNIEHVSTDKWWKQFNDVESIEQLVPLRKEFMLYRQKKDCIGSELPPIEYNEIRHSAKESQKEVYDAVFEADCKCVLQKITLLRLAADSGNLVDLASLTADDADKAAESEGLQSNGRSDVGTDSGLNGELCHKVGNLKKILKRVPVGDKVIIFSAWTNMLVYLQQCIDPDGTMSVLRHGRLDPDAKADTLKKFQSEEATRVLFCTLKSGGVGLNLTCANHVILMEPHFNEAEEQQAIARVYRFGQTKPVKVHRFGTTKSIDGWLNELKRTKLCIAKKVLEDAVETKVIEKCYKKTSDALQKYVYGYAKA